MHYGVMQFVSDFVIYSVLVGGIAWVLVRAGRKDGQ